MSALPTPNRPAPLPATVTKFDRDTALEAVGDGAFEGTISADWRAGRGPHGGYLTAIILRALTATVADQQRSPRSLSVHFLRAPEPGPVSVQTTVQRKGRSVSALSARLLQDGETIALALAAFSVPWPSPDIDDLPMPVVAGPDHERRSPDPVGELAPIFARELVLQPRFGAEPFSGSEGPMRSGGWTGLVEERPVDALAVALFSDAWFSPPFVRLQNFGSSPTIDLTIHFRVPLSVPREDPRELCLASFSSGLVRGGFFDEDGVIWGADGAVLAQARQLALLFAT